MTIARLRVGFRLVPALLCGCVGSESRQSATVVSASDVVVADSTTAVHAGADTAGVGAAAVGAAGVDTAVALIGETDSRQAASDARARLAPRSWPGPSTVVAIDRPGVLGGNLSGVTAVVEDGAVVLWAVRNAPSRLYRIVADGTSWRPDTAAGWADGRRLRYPNGSGSPDAEGVTLTAGGVEAGVYVASERDNDRGAVSRNSVLRFDVRAGSGALTATHEWQLNRLLPAVLPNRGIEAITWIPDADLVAAGFQDLARGTPYDPANYPDHGDGLFVVGLEANGALYVLALDHRTQRAALVATVRSGMASVMALEYDPATRELWASCDESCGGGVRVLSVDTTTASPSVGAFVLRRAYAPPAGRPASNHEGFAIAPLATCAAGFRHVFWTDDEAYSGHALRRGRIACEP